MDSLASLLSSRRSTDGALFGFLLTCCVQQHPSLSISAARPPIWDLNVAANVSATLKRGKIGEKTFLRG